MVSKILAATAALAATALYLAAPSAAQAAKPVQQMMLGAPVQGPVGYTVFCQGQPAECAPRTMSQSAELLDQGPSPIETAALNSPWRQAFERARLVRGSTAEPAPLLTGTAASAASGQGLFWQAAFQRARAGSTPQAAPTPAVQTVKIAYDRATQKMIDKVNRQINADIRPATDLAIYGVTDVWAEPLAVRERAGAAKPVVYGDCEDYVLEKRRALIQSGVPAQALSIAVARNRTGEDHAVLIVATVQGDYVLDNLSPWIRTWDQAPYNWVMRQVNGESGEWRTVIGGARQTTARSGLRL